ncbi:recombinase family protein [Frankia sp. Ag45/Mut15]|uniref:Recombinase family protein n=1 Tax=Frankia umida TaxID=573489 RepID=A0ABT0JYM2_9ACTN|nr:recombinase family protein [Frankia umida]MCK9876638.1 recombinase family protein [Frankia umida]
MFPRDTELPVLPAIYVRISQDRLGLEQGVNRQVELALEHAARHGWTVPENMIFRDNDISALTGAFRPGYAALMQAIADGKVNTVIVYQTSRLWRNRRERAEGIEVLRAVQGRLVAVRGQSFDLSTATGRGFASMLGEQDSMESEIKGERVADAAYARALEGRANGRVAYGWNREYITDSQGRTLGFNDVEDTHQADVVRWVVDQLLARVSLDAITRMLNERGEPGPTGGTWGSSSVRKIALRPMNVGVRMYKREPIGEAAAPAIVDAGKHAMVVALLGDPARVTSRSGARRHLLTYNSGLAACGVCGSQLRVGKVGKHVLYQCGAAGCVGRNQAKVDDYAELVFIERMLRPDAAAVFARHDNSAHDARAEADELRVRLAAAADDYADGVITREQLARITSGIRPKLERAEEAARRSIPEVGPDLMRNMIADPEATWRGLDEVSSRHALLVGAGMHIRIMPVGRGPGFNPRSIKISWPGVGAV